MKKTKPIDAVMVAVDAYTVARSEANWTNGYRVCYQKRADRTDAEEERLYQRERAQWAHVDKTQAEMHRVALRVLRDVRKEARP